MNSQWPLEIPGRKIRRDKSWVHFRGCLLNFSAALVGVLLFCGSARAQTQSNGAEAPPATLQLAAPPWTSTAPPMTLTLADAIARAEKNSPDFQSAAEQAKLAQHNRVQARAAMLPSISYRMDYQKTQGDKISPVGRFVTN